MSVKLNRFGMYEIDITDGGFSFEYDWYCDNFYDWTDRDLLSRK
jgi:hypothetical protein